MNYQQMPIYRPEDGVKNLIAAASERMDFYVRQIAILDESLTILIHEHAQIVEFYRSQVEIERTNIERMSGFLAGSQMAPAQQMALPLTTSAIGTVPHTGEMTITAEEMQAVLEMRRRQSEEAGNQKGELLRAFNSAEDQVPQKSLGDRSRREVVERAIPMQSPVSVVEYGPDEELPPEALTGHMDTEPRSAEELAAAKNKKKPAEDGSASSDVAS